MPLPYQAAPIVALATPPGSGAIAVVRLSGEAVINLVNQIFHGKDLTQQASHTAHFGTIVDGDTVLDEVLVTLFRAPRSFTQEDAVEISCHGSNFIVQQLIQLLVHQGARMAQPGEFTQRAFLNGRFDLAQAEAVADLIAADTSLAHRTALNQMRGGFSSQIKTLREKLIHFASLLELELDFAEEDVAFADRTALHALLQALLEQTQHLMQSFSWGNVIKNGIATVIAGKPNAGKSTLLNALVNEERAIVSPLPGTTRDVIEAAINVQGIRFRFIDTAGLRDTPADEVEAIGMAKTQEQLQKAALVIYLFDITTESLASLQAATQPLQASKTPYLCVGNKMDAATPAALQALQDKGYFLISAAEQQNLVPLKEALLKAVHLDQLPAPDTVVVNARHYESLAQSKEALTSALQGLNQHLSSELLAQDIRRALHALGTITGEVTTDELLGNLFSKFCIGK